MENYSAREVQTFSVQTPETNSSEQNQWHLPYYNFFIKQHQQYQDRYFNSLKTKKMLERFGTVNVESIQVELIKQENQQVLEEFMGGIDAQVIGNVGQFRQEGNAFLYSRVNYTDVLIDMGLVPKKIQNNDRERIDIFSFGGYGGGFAANSDEFYKHGNSSAMRSAHSEGEKEITCTVFGDVTTRGGLVTPELLGRINKEGIKPLAELYASAIRSFIEQDGNRTKRIIINGFSQGSNIAIEVARALKATFEDSQNPRVGKIPLSNKEFAEIQLLLDNPANIENRVNPMVLVGAAVYGIDKKMNNEISKSEHPQESRYENHILEILKLPKEDLKEQVLKKVAKIAIAKALVKGITTKGIPFYSRESIDNEVGWTRKHWREKSKHAERIIKFQTDKLTHARDKTVSENDFKDRNTKDFETVIKGRHLEILNRYVDRFHRVANSLRKMRNKAQETIIR